MELLQSSGNTNELDLISNLFYFCIQYNSIVELSEASTVKMSSCSLCGIHLSMYLFIMAKSVAMCYTVHRIERVEGILLI